MPKKVEITASIVLFNENFKELSKTIESFLETDLSKKLFLIDNSPSDKFRIKFTHPDIEYLFIGNNIGFGAGHNMVIDKIKNYSKYHLILNPDVSFSPITIPNLIKQLEKENNTAIIAPKVLFPNGEYQYSCRRYPSVFDLVIRRSGIFKRLFSKLIKKGEYENKNLKNPFSPEVLHGCFQLFRTNDFVSIKGFDERYFLYMEDIDICRKIDRFGKKKLYFPQEEIIHILKKGSSKQLGLFIIHFSSIVKYFFKWGFKK